MMVSGIKKKKTLLAMLDRNAGAIRSLQDKLSAYHLKLPCPINGNAAETVPKITKSIWEAKKEATKEKSTKTAKKGEKEQKRKRRKIKS